MKTWCQRLIDIASLARNSRELQGSLSDLVEGFGLKYFTHLVVHPSHTSLISNTPKSWQEIYVRDRFSDFDPIIRKARSLRAFHWSLDCWKSDRRLRQFTQACAAHGIRHGVCIPVRTAFKRLTVLILASDRQVLDPAIDIDNVMATTAVTYLHARFEYLNTRATACSPIDLTPKQALCLKWSAEGKPMKAIAAIENMSFSTVNFHLNNARRALDAGSLAQATATAVKLGLI